jgi:hypothetical protein
MGAKPEDFTKIRRKGENLCLPADLSVIFPVENFASACRTTA